MADKRQITTGACMIIMIAAALVLYRPALRADRVMMPNEVFSRMAGWQSSGVAVEDRRDFAVLTDQLHAMYPYKEYQRRSLLEGRVPLWNPYQSAGAPFAANPQSGVFYPVAALLLLAMPAGQYMGVNALLHCILAGVAMFLMLRAMRCSAAAALAGGLGYMLCGWMTIWNTFEGFHNAAAWAPLAVMFNELALRRGVAERVRVAHSALGGGALGIMVLSGGAQVAAYTGIACAIQCAGAVFQGGGGSLFGARLRASATALVCMFAAGLLVGAVQAIPALELAGGSVRAVGNYASGGAAAGLAAFFIPDALGNPITGAFRGYPPMYVEGPAYCGAAVGALAAAGLLLVRDRTRMCLGLAAALGVCGALALPFMGALSSAPGLGLMRMHRMSFLVSFAAPALAAAGWDAVVSPRKKGGAPGWAAVAAGFAIVGGVCAALMYSAPGKAEHAPLIYAGALCVVVVVLAASARLSAVWPSLLLAGVVAADMLAWGAPLIPSGRARDTFPALPAIEKILTDRGLFRVQGLHGIMHPDMAMVYGLQDIRGYDPFGLNDYAALVKALNRPMGLESMSGAVMVPAVYDHPAADLMGVKYIMSMTRLDEARFERVYTGEMLVYRNPRALERARFYTRWRVMRDGAKSAEAVAGGKFDPRAEVLLEKDPGIRAAAGASGRARVARYSPEEVVVETESAAPGVLFVADAWEKNWRADVDGERVEIIKADRAFRAVAVGAGRHVVRMEYAPVSVAVGAALSAIGAVGLFAIGAAGWRRR